MSAVTWVGEKKITGTIIKDDESFVRFHIETMDGETWWAKEKDCKRLVRKKKEKKRFDTFKILMESLAYFKFINKNHVPASGKKVEGEKFCECHTMILFHRDDDPSVCAKCSKFFKPGVIPITDTLPEKEFCECKWKRGYDKHGIHVQSIVTAEDFAKNKNSVNPCFKEIERHRQDDFLVKSSSVKEKHVCNPALWETQCIKNIATSKLINELCRKVEKLEEIKCAGCFDLAFQWTCMVCGKPPAGKK